MRFSSFSTNCHEFRRGLDGCVTGACVFAVGMALACLTATAAAQEGSGGGVRVESSGRSFTVEALVVAFFLGLALFSVCRSSRRV